MMTVYPIVTALTGFQATNLVSYFARILPQLLGLYTTLLLAPDVLTLIPSRVPWLLIRLVLMGLDAYFPQLSQCLPSGHPSEQLSQ
ncbi:hypothetical protein DSO57_1003962 [Entomophthora muscae]|uniref:Uncharacterized protein n=1 Tax=Entomophthora muscae TaxID=34485 RepID=A0ACC2TW34_9FUNG|nr:hypothetical protein DSO57_1003962 [Entomophthora muscae]